MPAPPTADATAGLDETQPHGTPWPWETDPAKCYPDKDPSKLTEFERRYPPDPVGHELKGNARIFRVYQDRMNELDADTIAGWTDAINFLLVFAGLFSAILTAFLLELSKKLEPDYAEYSSRALFIIASIDSGKNVTISEAADPDSFRPKANHRAINALWFTSLTLSLITSMLAILAKQWIGMFVSRMRMPARDLRYWARRHRAYRDGVERWKLNAFVSSLSVALYLALLLFLVGLIVHTRELDLVVFALVTALSGLALVIYLVATVAPLFAGTCPTATPLLLTSWGFVLWVWNRIRVPEGSTAARYSESRVVPQYNKIGNADVDILAWIINKLPGEQDFDVALDAMAALPILPEDQTSAPGVVDDTSLTMTTEQTKDILLWRLQKGVKDWRSAETGVNSSSEAPPGSAPDRSGESNRLAHCPPVSRLLTLLTGRRHDELETNAEELARALRTIMRCATTLPDRAAIAAQLHPLLHVRTHDVAVLSEMLSVHLRWGECPPDADGIYHVYHVSRITVAFGGWAELPIQQRIISPISPHTCGILYKFLQTRRLSISLYCSLILVFGHNQDKTTDWIGLCTGNLIKDLRTGVVSDVGMSWRNGVAWVKSLPLCVTTTAPRVGPQSGDESSHHDDWSSLLLRLRIGIASDKDLRHAMYRRAAQCFNLILEQRHSGSELDAVKQTNADLLAFLGKASNPPQHRMTKPATALVGDLALTFSAAERCITMEDRWNVDLMTAVFDIVNRSYRLHPPPKGLAEGVAALLQRLLPEGLAAAYEDLVSGYEMNLRSGNNIVAFSALSVLAPRSNLGGSPTSIWRLAMTLCADENDIYSKFADCVLGLSAQLTVAAALGHSSVDVASMFDQLLGQGYGARFILEGNVPEATSLEIMRHVAASAPEQWKAIRAELRTGTMCHSNLLQDTHAEPIALADDDGVAQENPACPKCSAVVERLRVEQSVRHYQSNHTVVSSNDGSISLEDVTVEDRLVLVMELDFPRERPQ